MSSEMSDARPLLVVHDPEDGHLVYDLLLLESGDDETTLACFPRPVARFPLPSWCCSFAVVPGGAILCAQYDWLDTLFHDSVMRVGGYDYFERRARPGMPTHDAEGRPVRWWPLCRGFRAPRRLAGSYQSTPAVLPVGGGGGAAVVRMDTVIFNGIYNWETLRPLPSPDGEGGGGGWRAAPLPKAPIGRLDESELANELAFLTAYFAVGARVWISVARKGTFSLDTATGAPSSWRAEGAWQLPFEGRALHVPELGSVFGFAAGTTAGLLCACDVSQRAGTPPVVLRRVWRETLPLPWEECLNDDEGQHPDTRVRDLPSLAYLGKGRFCICRPMGTMEPTVYGTPITYSACAFLVVEVRRLPGGELELARRGKMSYMRPPHGRQCPYIGFIQPAT